MEKKRNDELMRKAEEALHDTRVKIIKENSETDIKESYNGQTAALGVTIAMSGLRPAIAIYQQETDGCNRIQILNAIAIMLGTWNGENPGVAMSRALMSCNDNELREYQKKIIECSIALKQVIRTYNLVKS